MKIGTAEHAEHIYKTLSLECFKHKITIQNIFEGLVSSPNFRHMCRRKGVEKEIINFIKANSPTSEETFQFIYPFEHEMNQDL